MKDAYSFDRDEDGLARASRRNRERVQADLRALRARALRRRRPSRGIMGGKRVASTSSRRRGSGENTLVTLRERRLRRRPRGGARRSRGRRCFPERLDAPEEVETPGVTTIEALAEFLGIDAAATSKAMPVVQPDGTLVLALVRGDDRLEEAKLLRRSAGAFRPADGRGDPDRVRRGRRLARPGRLRGRGHRRRGAARGAVRGGREPRRLAPARRRGRPRLRAALRRPARAARGRRCPECGGALRFRTAIEVGHIFKLGTLLLGAARRDVPRRGRAARSRCSWAATASGPAASWPPIVEQHHDEHGIVWPRAVAPYDVHVVVLCRAWRSRRRGGRAASSRQPALDVLLDDRELRPGEKFADADLHRRPRARHRRQEDARGRRGRRAVRQTGRSSGCGS